MDTFDTLTLSVFVLLLLPLVARCTIWKQKGQPLRVWSAAIILLMIAIPILTLSTVHHWNAPHRRVYQFILAMSGILVSLASLTVHSWERVKARH